MDLTIGLVNFNTQKYMKGCLESIYTQETDYSFEVVVVDNASTDGSIEWLQEKYPQVRMVKNSINVGVARGNNQAISEGKGRYIFLLNTDTVLQPGTLQILISFLDAHPKAGAVGGRLIFEDGSFQSSFDNFPNLWLEFLGITRIGPLINPRFPSNPDCRSVRDVDWISSASLVIRKSAVEQIGLIDESFFIYGDETDLQLRLHQAGWEIFFLPEVETIHFGGKSLDRWRRRRLVNRGKILYFHKNHPFPVALGLRVILLITSILKNILWGIIWLSPDHRKRAGYELKSNLEIVQLCCQPYDEMRAEFNSLFSNQSSGDN